MNNNSLIEVKDNIFTRFFRTIKSFFFKPRKRNNENLAKEVDNNESPIKEVAIKEERNEYKEKIFTLYNKIKKHQIKLEKLETIEIQDLEKVKVLLEEELRIKKEKLEKKKIELQMCRNELKMLNG